MIIKMNVGDQRDPYLTPNLWKGFGRFFLRNSHADDLASDRLKPLNLSDGGRNIARIGGGHRLHHNRRVSSDLYRSDRDLSGFSANNPHRYPFIRKGQRVKGQG